MTQTIYSGSLLKAKIDGGEWLGDDIASLWTDDVEMRPYLIGDCAFPLSRNIICTTSEIQQARDCNLKMLENYASQARKPIECAFGILKKIFSILSRKLGFHHEDIVSKVIVACAILHKLCNEQGDCGKEFFEADESSENEIVTNAGYEKEGVIIRKALTGYIKKPK